MRNDKREDVGDGQDDDRERERHAEHVTHCAESLSLARARGRDHWMPVFHPIFGAAGGRSFVYNRLQKFGPNSERKL